MLSDFVRGRMSVIERLVSEGWVEEEEEEEEEGWSLDMGRERGD